MKDQLNQQDLATKFGIEDSRVLIAYIQDHADRADGLIQKDRLRIAKYLFGNELCESWLTEGRWTSDAGRNLAPAWLLDQKLESRVHAFVRLISLIRYRGNAISKGLMSDQLASEFVFLPLSESKEFTYGNAEAWNPAWYKRHSPELCADQNLMLDFSGFLAAMKVCRIWHKDLIRYQPFDVGRAYEAYYQEMSEKSAQKITSFDQIRHDSPKVKPPKSKRPKRQ